MESWQIAYDILDNIASDPYILFIGENFDIKSEINKTILNQKWGLIFTSNSDGELVYELQKYLSSYREVREQKLKNLLTSDNLKIDSRNLRLIRLFDNESKITDKSQSSAAYKLTNILDSKLKNGGRFVIVGYSITDSFPFLKMKDVFSYISNREYKIVLFGADEVLSKEIADFNEQSFDADNYKPVYVCSEELGKLLPMSNEEYKSDYDDDDSSNDDSLLKFWVNNKRKYLDKNDVKKINDFATFLNEDELEESRVISEQHIPTYFSRFLEKSAYSPEWYGFREKFNLVRDYEITLLTTTKRGLDTTDVLKEENIPICLKGESGSGKSVAAAHLAYRIYHEKIYPVIYIKSFDIEYKIEKTTNGGGKRIYSERLDALNKLLQILESDKIGAKSTLIVLDISAFESNMEKCKRIFELFRTTYYRKVQFVFTGYENIKEENHKDDIQFVAAKMKLNIDKHENETQSEVERLQTILRRKAKWDKGVVDDVIERLTNDEEIRKNFMIILYKLFEDSRETLEDKMRTYINNILWENYKKKPFESYMTIMEAEFAKLGDKLNKFIEQGLYKTDENKGSSKIADNRLMEKIKNVIKTAAVCTKYGLNISLNLAMRMIELDDGKIKDLDRFKDFFSIVYLIIDHDENDVSEYIMRFRTRYEAEIYLSALGIERDSDTDAIVDMINNMNIPYANYYDNYELKLVVNILHTIGANSKDFHNSIQINDYKKIIDALRGYRYEHGLNPSLTVQEAAYMREYAVSPQVQLSNEEKCSYFEEAIDVCEEAISVLDESTDVYVYKMLISEKMNSRVRFLQKVEISKTYYNEKEYEHDMTDIDNARSYYPDDSYLITTKLWLMGKAYEIFDENKKAEIAVSALYLKEMVENDYKDIANTSNFIQPINELLEKIEPLKQESYIETLIQNQNPYGYYLKAYNEYSKQILKKRDSKSIVKYTEEEAHLCADICASVFENNWTTQFDIKCQRLRLKLKWIAYNKSDIFGKNEQFTQMNIEQWWEFYKICNDLLSYRKECTNETLMFFYIKALACLQLVIYNEFSQLMKEIRSKTENQNLRDNNRVRVRHMLCNEKGIPKTFRGKFNDKMPDNALKGYYVELYDINRSYTRNEDIFFNRTDFFNHKPYKDNTTFKSGTPYNDFQLGLGYMGLAAYRGMKKEEET